MIEQQTMRTVISEQHDIGTIDAWCDQNGLPSFKPVWLNGSIVGWVADLPLEQSFLTRLRWN